MDLCSVGSVKDLMKTCVETLDEIQIAMIAREVLRGLAYLHERGIVHMDVKAANILLTEDGSVKLGTRVDFRGFRFFPAFFHILSRFLFFPPLLWTWVEFQ